METVQVVIDTKLRKEADVFSKRLKVNRSALIRKALREFLKRERTREMEERELRAYKAHPDTDEDWDAWEREAVWPAN
jgi:metal-responsive CopG/Arc/MetJ family transcriptional regulator